MRRGAKCVSSASKGGNDGVLSGCGWWGGIMSVEVSVRRFSVDGGWSVRMNKNVEEGDGAIVGGVFDSVLEVFC